MRFVRHAGLRVPLQVVGDPCLPVWSETDLCGLDEREREAEVRRRWEEETLSPASLELPSPALSLDLLHLADSAWELLVSLPALCADDPTLDLLVAEVAARYAGEEAEDEPLQFLDYADWQSELLESAAADPEEQVRGERRRADLASRLDLELPLARRGAAPEWRGAGSRVPVDAGLAADLQAASAAAG